MVPITGFNLDLYDARLAEWDALLTSAQSATLRDLFQQAKATTEQALQRLVEIQRMSLVILTANKITFDKNMALYTAQVQQVNTEVQVAKASRTVLPGLAEQFSVRIQQVQAQAMKEKTLYEVSQEVYSLGIAQFQKVLEKIYQPRNGSFHYESIVDGFQFVADKVLPGLSEFKSVRQLVPSIRKKTFAQTSDKLLLYVEQYLDVLAKWEDLAGAYVRLLQE
jgi:hypothetical protein